ncbi:MAG: thioesterase family protein [Oceanospirillaceae bacterium]|nr:thioesterase family protein [Oceanospirillaceae bacterium]
MTYILNTLQTLATPVIKDWIDYNGHLNDAYYLVIFTKATDALQNHLGLTLDHIQNTGETLFTVESHLTYLQEIGLGEMVTITTQLLQTDNKRMRVFHRMYNDQNDLLATVEMLFLCYNLNAKKVSNFSQMMVQSLALLEKEHKDIPWPEQAGKGIALTRSAPL